MEPETVVVYPLLPIYDQFPDIKRSVHFLPKEEKSLFEYCFMGIEDRPMYWPSLAQAGNHVRDHIDEVVNYVQDQFDKIGIRNTDHFEKNGMTIKTKGSALLATADAPRYDENIEAICDRFHGLIAPNHNQAVVVRDLKFLPKAIMVTTQLCQTPYTR